MSSRQKLLWFWLSLLLVAAFCPGPHLVHGKRGMSSWKKSSSSKSSSSSSSSSSSEGRDLSKQGLKLAGAAAAVAGTGYGMGVLGQSRHGSGKHGWAGSSRHNRDFYDDPQGYYNQTRWHIEVSGAPAPNRSLTPGCVVSFLVAVWIRGM